MLAYLIVFGLGYFVGKNGLPQQAPIAPGQPAPSWSLPAGYTVDAAGNVYDPRGVLVISASSIGSVAGGTSPTQPGTGAGYAQPGILH